jgi:hypothetical protein
VRMHIRISSRLGDLAWAAAGIKAVSSLSGVDGEVTPTVSSTVPGSEMLSPTIGIMCV